MTIISTAKIETEQAERLIIQLCKHWGHKFPVRQGERWGEIDLPLGTCRMRADDAALSVELEGEADQMSRLQEVVAEHLQRMARKEELVIRWQ